MKLFLTPEGRNEVKLHDYGNIMIRSQESQLVPPEFPQKEIITLTIQIDVFPETYRDYTNNFEKNYEKIESLRDALRKGANAKLKWQDEDVLDEETGEPPQGSDGNGAIYLEQTVVVTQGLTLPENPNSWGTYLQSITFQVRYENFDVASDKSHIVAKFTLLNKEPIVLGSIWTWKEDYRVGRYSEYRSIRERTSGVVTFTGEIPSDPELTPDQRRLYLFREKDKLDLNVNNSDGRLQYYCQGNTFFDRTVKVDAWTCEVDQAAYVLRYSCTASYTKFPDEEGYAGADFTASVGQDRESGDDVLSLSGRIMAASESLALAKLEVVRTSMMANGFSTSGCVRKDQTSRHVNADDGADFIELAFQEQYRKRSSEILAYAMNISSSDDARSGFVQYAYQGSVTASGSTYTTAYAAALAKAELLGKSKYPVMLSARIGVGERQLTNAEKEFVRLEFSYDYLAKGTHVFVELATQNSNDTFGEDTQRVSGFVAAPTMTECEAIYQASVKAPLQAYIIRREGKTTSSSTYKESSGGVSQTLEGRLDFDLDVYKPKATGTLNIAYVLDVDFDYVGLKKIVTVSSGRFVSDSASMLAALNGTTGNALDGFLLSLGINGQLVRSKRSGMYNKQGSHSELTGVSFDCQYVCKLSNSQQIVQVELSEEITYTGTRWQFRPTPDGTSVPQNCGTQEGSRTLSGSITGATETACRAMLAQITNMPFPGATPTYRYTSPPRISTAWEMLPLETPTFSNRASNAVLCKLSFQFGETLLYYPYS